MATKPYRESLRLVLIKEGFRRVDYSDVDSHGNYWELWKNGEETVTLTWGAPVFPEISPTAV